MKKETARGIVIIVIQLIIDLIIASTFGRTFGLMAVVVGMIYFLPAYIALNKKDFNAIYALNLFLGWSLVGWVVALVLALKKDSEAQILVNHTDSSSEQIEKMHKLFLSGAIDKEEFDAFKRKMLG